MNFANTCGIGCWQWPPSIQGEVHLSCVSFTFAGEHLENVVLERAFQAVNDKEVSVYHAINFMYLCELYFSLHSTAYTPPWPKNLAKHFFSAMSEVEFKIKVSHSLTPSLTQRLLTANSRPAYWLWKIGRWQVGSSSRRLPDQISGPWCQSWTALCGAGTRNRRRKGGLSRHQKGEDGGWVTRGHDQLNLRTVSCSACTLFSIRP